jgi:integrase
MPRSRNLGRGEGSVYQEKGTGKWRGEIRQGTTRRRVTGDTRADVVGKLDTIRSGLAAGLPVGDNTRVGPWLTWYLDEVISDSHPNTQASYRWAVDLLEPLYGFRLRDLKVEDVEGLLKTLATRKPRKPAPGKRRDKPGRGGHSGPLGRSSLTRVRMVLGAALHEAERRDLVGRNVAKLAHLPSTARAPQSRRALTPAQASKLVDTATGHRDEAMILMGVMLGLRPGEILGLPWDAVDLKRRTLEVKQSLKRLPDKSLVIGPPKADSHRKLQLPGRIVTALEAHKRQQKKDRLAAPVWEEHGLVFTSVIGTPFDPSNFRRLVSKIGEDAEVGHLSPNELRHTAASLLVDAGTQPQIVADMLGHRDMRMLAQTYRHKVRPIVDVTEDQDQMLS